MLATRIAPAPRALSFFWGRQSNRHLAVDAHGHSASYCSECVDECEDRGGIALRQARCAGGRLPSQSGASEGIGPQRFDIIGGVAAWQRALGRGTVADARFEIEMEERLAATSSQRRSRTA